MNLWHIKCIVRHVTISFGIQCSTTYKYDWWYVIVLGWWIFAFNRILIHNAVPMTDMLRNNITEDCCLKLLMWFPCENRRRLRFDISDKYFSFRTSEKMRILELGFSDFSQISCIERMDSSKLYSPEFYWLHLNSNKDDNVIEIDYFGQNQMECWNSNAYHHNWWCDTLILTHFPNGTYKMNTC